MKTNEELIEWLREHSSGSYRPSADGADRLQLALFVLRDIMRDMPAKRDWLNPDIEKNVKWLLSLDNHTISHAEK